MADACGTRPARRASRRPVGPTGNRGRGKDPGVGDGPAGDRTHEAKGTGRRGRVTEEILPGPLPQFLDAGRGTAKTVTHRAIAVRAVGHFLAPLIDEQATGRSQQGVRPRSPSHRGDSTTPRPPRHPPQRRPGGRQCSAGLTYARGGRRRRLRPRGCPASCERNTTGGGLRAANIRKPCLGRRYRKGRRMAPARSVSPGRGPNPRGLGHGIGPQPGWHRERRVRPPTPARRPAPRRKPCGPRLLPSAATVSPRRTPGRFWRCVPPRRSCPTLQRRRPARATTAMFTRRG